MNRTNGTPNGAGQGVKVTAPKREARPTPCASCEKTCDRADMCFVHGHGILCGLCFFEIAQPGQPKVERLEGGETA